jgi:hypothetical protein
MEPARFRRLLARYLGPEPDSWNPWFIQEIAAIDDPEGFDGERTLRGVADAFDELMQIKEPT